ncbi:MAG: hypothetical protein WBV94_10525 [Blastocatellia bacterium]
MAKKQRSSTIAILSEHRDRIEREQKQAQREPEIADSMSIEEIDAALDDYCRRVDLLVEAFLLVEEYEIEQLQARIKSIEGENP